MSKEFSEMTRVQIPAMIHLTRLGYQYLGKLTEEMAGVIYDLDTNILKHVFLNQFRKLNPDQAQEAERTLTLIRQELDNDDLGKSFYQRLKSISPTRLIDFEHIENNVFHFTGEFTCKNGQEEFRPDITLFVNGLPLVFIEVKKPNNIGGMLAESKRMTHERFPNRYFRRFINITQFMIFSNHMEYSADGGIVPIQGAFYCTSARDTAFFNSFREKNPKNEGMAPYHRNFPYIEIDKEVEWKIVTDFNCHVIHDTPEYNTNLDINTPTNRILTSMCAPERLLYILKYGLAYVRMEKEVDGKLETTDQKHIMRYQQLFASFAITRKLDEGIRSGIIWHTQGSGKTALSFYLTYILTDYYARQNKVPKFYFIVDRLDLLKQATQEFEARGLTVSTANTRAELMAQFRRNQALEGNTGKTEITVVNIQRFAEDKEKIHLPEYATNLQRIFIIDEAHRGYKPSGCFLSNLFDADKNSIKIALSGTPLLKEEISSCAVFGNYLDTYYYNQSIEDGYTLKIIREDIETSWREKLKEAYDKLDTLVQKKTLRKSDIIEHENYVRELTRYIITDLKRFRKIQNDNDLGGMVICETSEQARKMVALFDEVQQEINHNTNDKTSLTAGLILHDSEDKKTREDIVDNFKKKMTVDILVVFNMLLTGFDAPRLKRLYFGRKLKDHNLLQALTRVNRPYKDNRYGYVIDFADIKQNFEQTNAAYLAELNRFTSATTDGAESTDNITTLINVIENQDELEQQIKQARQILFNYDINNAERFSQEISDITSKAELQKLKKALETLKNCANIIRTFGDQETKKRFAKFDFTRVSPMLSEVNRHNSLINLQGSITDPDGKLAINEAMSNIEFKFNIIKKEEMQLVSGADEFQKKWQRTIHSFTQNEDQDDPEYTTLREAFAQRFKERGFVYHDMAKFTEDNQALDEIIQKLDKLRRNNNNLKKRYGDDIKLVRVHKRIREENQRRYHENKKPVISEFEEDIVEVLSGIKKTIDQKIYNQNHILGKDAYFEQTVLSQVATGFQQFPHLKLTPEMEDYIFIQQRISKQYLNQYHATYAQ